MSLWSLQPALHLWAGFRPINNLNQRPGTKENILARARLERNYFVSGPVEVFGQGCANIINRKTEENIKIGNQFFFNFFSYHFCTTFTSDRNFFLLCPTAIATTHFTSQLDTNFLFYIFGDINYSF